MHKIITQLTLSELKTVSKNLGKYLEEELGIKISHSSLLNLAAGGFGFKDYNTIKAHLHQINHCYVFKTHNHNVSLGSILESMTYFIQHAIDHNLSDPDEYKKLAGSALCGPNNCGLIVQDNFVSPEMIVGTINKNTHAVKVYIRSLEVSEDKLRQLLEQYKDHFYDLEFIRTSVEKELDTIPFALISQQFGVKVKYVDKIDFDSEGEKELFSAKDEKIAYQEKVIERLHRVIETKKVLEKAL